MSIDWSFVATIGSPIVALFVGALLNRAIERRSRLITYIGHVGAHTLKQQDGTALDVYTHSVVLRNAGGRSAMNVRLAHPYLPDFNVLPDVQHEVRNLPGGGRELLFPILVPKEQVTISYLYFPPTTWNQINGPVKSDAGHAKVLQVLPTQQFPPWFNRIAASLMIVGLVATVYVAVEVIGMLM